MIWLKWASLFLALFSNRIGVLCCWLGTNSSVSQEASPELGAKGRMVLWKSRWRSILAVMELLSYMSISVVGCLHCFLVHVFLFIFVGWASSKIVADVLILNMFSVTEKPFKCFLLWSLCWREMLSLDGCWIRSCFLGMCCCWQYAYE